MRLTPKSRQAKGKRFEVLIAKEIEAMGFGAARREGGSGSGTKKGDIAANLPFLIEAKNHISIHPLSWVDQAKKQAEIGNYDKNKWALVFRDPRSPETQPEIYAVIDFWEFLTLLKKDSAPMVKEPDRQQAWDLKQLKDAISRVQKWLPKT